MTIKSEMLDGYVGFTPENRDSAKVDLIKIADTGEFELAGVKFLVENLEDSHKDLGLSGRINVDTRIGSSEVVFFRGDTTVNVKQEKKGFITSIAEIKQNGSVMIRITDQRLDIRGIARFTHVE